MGNWRRLDGIKGIEKDADENRSRKEIVISCDYKRKCVYVIFVNRDGFCEKKNGVFYNLGWCLRARNLNTVFNILLV